MKLEKGYTLSQFVDLLNSKYNDYDFYKSTIKYNDFIKQPLKKEMFVNELEEPEQEEFKGDSESYNMQYKEWQEDEKKVIFKDVEIRYSSMNVDVLYVNKRMIAQIPSSGDCLFNDNTLYDLFNMTKGCLTLQNVEI
jgi:hypothetical protein